MNKFFSSPKKKNRYFTIQRYVNKAQAPFTRFTYMIFIVLLAKVLTELTIESG